MISLRQSTVGVRIWDAEAHASSVALQYQRSGETTWNACTILSADRGAPGSALASQPGGASHNLLWNASLNLGATFNGTVLIRTQAADTATGSWSEPMPYTVNTAADIDSDGDGASDLTEQLFGTSPTNPNSRPAVQLTRNANGSLTFSWPTAAGRTYRLETSTTLGRWVTLQSGLSTNTVTIPAPNPSAEPKRYYRIAAE